LRLSAIGFRSSAWSRIYYSNIEIAMNERERWIVYPLLFLALGAALRDKLVDRTMTKSIVCQELLVVDDQPLGRDPVLLARLGPRNQPTPGGVPEGELRLNGQVLLNGQVVLNGDLQIVDRDPTVKQLLHRLVVLGRGQIGAKNELGGLVMVNGQVLVNGVVNAAFYAYQGQPIVPVLRGVVPGASIPAELLRAIPEALAPRMPANVPEPAPSANSPEEATPVPTSPSPPAGDESKSEPSAQPGAASDAKAADDATSEPAASSVPLADPGESR
jgi:hypothetical protein